MIFVSYSSKDLEKVEYMLAEVRESIEEEIWFGKERIKPHDEWINLVKDAISRARVILYFLSENSEFGYLSKYLNEEKKMLLEEMRSKPDKLFITALIDNSVKSAREYPFIQEIRLMQERTLNRPTNRIKESKGIIDLKNLLK